MSFDQIKILLEKENNGNEKLFKTCKRGSETLKRLSSIVDGLMKFARDGSGDDIEDCSLNALVDEIKVYFHEKSLNSGIEFTIDRDLSTNVFVEARYVQLQQVLVNLLNNSYYEVQKLEEKWIHLEISEKEGPTFIKVTDSEKGVSPDIAQKIVSPFFTTKPVGEGTGLGLSISKGVLESFSADLYLDQEHPNTCFVIQLKTSSSGVSKSLA